jgi:large subunit ribosomal protein L16
MAVVHYKKQYKKKKIIIVIKKNLGTLKFGYYGIKSLQSGILDINQLETIRRIITKLTKRYSKIYIRVYFHHPVTIKPLLTRMGKGVGNIKF